MLPEEKKVLQARELVNWDYVEYTTDEIFLPKIGMGLDFGGFGKELAVDKIAGLLRSHGVENFLINFGGDIFASGQAGDGEDWRIGIESPNQEGPPAYVIKLKNHGLASSGNYRKFFDVGEKRYGHTLDPRTGYPTIHSHISASVVSPSCLKSGILSTSCILEGKEKGLQMVEAEWGTEGCIQTPDFPLSWLYHHRLGWLFAESTALDEFWFYDTDLGWLYTSKAIHPYFFRNSTQSWLYHLEDSGSHRFWDYSSETTLP
jgi:thiamine biosynthesis lipoprotein